MDLALYLKQKRDMVNAALDRYLPGDGEYPPLLHQAMRYSVFAGGKRLRPVLALAAGEAVGGQAQPIMPIACSLELIHTSSLIHDDLPAMDNDDLRRGRPTCHKQFGEAIAILSGDALLTLAFKLLADPVLTGDIGAEAQVKIIWELSYASGDLGLIGGQAVDILSQAQKVSPAQLEYIHTHKTGELIRAALKSGAIAAGADDTQASAISAYGEKIGLAFQIIDDILDIEGETSVIGKPAGSDLALDKATYPAMWGIERSRQKAQELTASALDDIAPLGEGGYWLAQIAQYIVKRQH